VRRAKKLDRVRDDLARPRRSLGSRHYPDEAAVAARLAAIAKDRRVDAYLRGYTGTDPATGKTHPGLAWPVVFTHPHVRKTGLAICPAPEPGRPSVRSGHRLTRLRCLTAATAPSPAGCARNVHW
jgi:hypothetical protein